jgi:hypothetical protein
MRRDLAPSDVLKRGFADVHDDYAVAADILGASIARKTRCRR